MRYLQRVFLYIFISETFQRSYPYNVCISDGPFECPINYNRMSRDVKLYKKSRCSLLKTNLKYCWHEFEENWPSRFCALLELRYRDKSRDAHFLPPPPSYGTLNWSEGVTKKVYFLSKIQRYNPYNEDFFLSKTEILWTVPLTQGLNTVIFILFWSAISCLGQSRINYLGHNSWRYNWHNGSKLYI